MPRNRKCLKSCFALFQTCTSLYSLTAVSNNDYISILFLVHPLQVPTRHLRRYRPHPVFQHRLQLVCQRQFQQGTGNSVNKSIFLKPRTAGNQIKIGSLPFFSLRMSDKEKLFETNFRIPWCALKSSYL